MTSSREEAIELIPVDDPVIKDRMHAPPSAQEVLPELDDRLGDVKTEPAVITTQVAWKTIPLPPPVSPPMISSGQDSAPSRASTKPVEVAPSVAPAPTHTPGLTADILFEDIPHDTPKEQNGSAAPSPPGKWTQTDQQAVERHIADLEQARTEIVEHHKRAGEDVKAAAPLERARSRGRELLSACADAIDTLSKRPEAKGARQSLVDAYFRLQRAVEQGSKASDTGEDNLKPRSKVTEGDTAARDLARRAREATRERFRLGRGAKLAILFGLLLAGRIAFYFAAESSQPNQPNQLTTALPEHVGVMTDFHNHTPGKPDGGDLSIRRIVLTQSSEGLNCNVICDTKKISDIASVSYTYTWFENNEVLTVGSSPTLEASKLRAKSTYHVEVTATLGDKTTSGASQKLLFTAGNTPTKER